MQNLSLILQKKLNGLFGQPNIYLKLRPSDCSLEMNQSGIDSWKVIEMEVGEKDMGNTSQMSILMVVWIFLHLASLTI